MLRFYFDLFEDQFYDVIMKKIAEEHVAAIVEKQKNEILNESATTIGTRSQEHNKTESRKQSDQRD